MTYPEIDQYESAPATPQEYWDKCIPYRRVLAGDGKVLTVQYKDGPNYGDTRTVTEVLP
jgi:hypothetical protein